MARTALGSNDYRGPAIGRATLMPDITYAGSFACDIWKPAVENRPVLLILHGGAWNDPPDERNDLAFYGDIAGRFADYGLAVVNADYQGANGTPQDVIDSALTLVQWARDNAATYNFNATRVAILGASSGGHAGLMAGIQGTPGEDRPDAVIGWSPVTDMVNSYDFVPDEMENYFGVALTGNEDLYEEFSPANAVTANCPPLRIVGSDAEDTNPPGAQGPPVTQYTDMETAAEAVGVSVTMRIVSGVVHSFFDGRTPYFGGAIGTNDIPGSVRWIYETLGDGGYVSTRAAASRTAASGRVAA